MSLPHQAGSVSSSRAPKRARHRLLPDGGARRAVASARGKVIMKAIEAGNRSNIERVIKGVHRIVERLVCRCQQAMTMPRRGMVTLNNGRRSFAGILLSCHFNGL